MEYTVTTYMDNHRGDREIILASTPAEAKEIHKQKMLAKYPGANVSKQVCRKHHNK